MLTESVRMLAEWFDDATYGINALIADVPRETDIALPDALTVMDETNHPEIAREQMPDVNLPALLVSTAATPVDQANPANRPFPADMNVDVLVRYCSKNSDTAQAGNEGRLVVRALFRSINRFMTPGVGPSRVRNQVQVIHVARIAVQNMYQPNNDTVVTVAVLLTLQCRDLHASA